MSGRMGWRAWWRGIVGRSGCWRRRALGDRLAAWWDSLGLDEEQQVWMARLWEVFRTSSTVGELDERLGRYEESVVEALGVERSGVMFWSSGVWYSFAVLVFGREGWVEAFWSVVLGLMGAVAAWRVGVCWVAVVGFGWRSRTRRVH